MSTLVDETGKTYGPYTVIGRACLPRRNVHWKCRCECGQIDIIAGNNLRAGKYYRTCPHNAQVDAQRLKMQMLAEEWRSRYIKYGCADCKDRPKCDVNKPCKYASELDGYRNYREYLQDN